jgi:alkane 1-monooxygenase
MARLDARRGESAAMADLPYLSSFLVAIAMALGLGHGASWPFSVVVAVFAAITVADLLEGGSSVTADEAGGASAAQGPFWRLAIWLWVPAQAAIIVCGIRAATAQPLTLLQFLRIAVAVGMITGMLGTPVAHELMHRRSFLQRGMAEFLMALSSYSHFCVEHVRGHHLHVATPGDGATARLGESLYAFYLRAVASGWASAWKIEARRQLRLGRSVLDIRNGVVRGLLISGAFYGAAAFFAGPAGLGFFALQSLVAVLVLETVNYVQHYGLRRRQGDDGLYERVGPMHAWNAEPRVSNAFLLNLGRHSDHHCCSREPFIGLKRCSAAPTLPTGIPGMCMLAVLPPLWFQVMDPLVAAYNGRTA